MGGKYWLKGFLFLILISALMTGTAWAEDREKIGRVVLDFSTDIIPGKSGGDVSVTRQEDANYSIGSVTITNEPEDKWNKVESPQVEIEIYTDVDQYYFGSASSSGFKLNLEENEYIRRVDFKKAERRENKSMILLTVKLAFRVDSYTMKKVYNPSNIRWDTPGMACWDRSIGSAQYEVQLEKDGELTGEIHTVTETKYNFSPQIQEEGMYRFRIRAVNEFATKGKWMNSRRVKITREELEKMSAGWKKAEDQIRWWWSNGDGTWPFSQWKEVDGNWYYFDAEGYMAVGWISVDGKEYYLNPETGAMYHDTVTPDGSHVGPDGAKYIAGP